MNFFINIVHPSFKALLIIYFSTFRSYFSLQPAYSTSKLWERKLDRNLQNFNNIHNIISYTIIHQITTSHSPNFIANIYSRLVVHILSRFKQHLPHLLHYFHTHRQWLITSKTTLTPASTSPITVSRMVNPAWTLTWAP